jgi:transposase
MRDREEVLRPRFLPFMKKLKEKYGYKFVVQEDNASAHISKWCRDLWREAGFEVLDWPANSPDLSAIEPPWAKMKTKTRKKKVSNSRVELEREWKRMWQEFPQEKLQRYVERVQGNIQWVIRLAGGNEYKEGTIPPPLEADEEEPGLMAWRDWMKKSRADREEELQHDIQEDSMAEWEDFLTMDTSISE